MHITSRGNGPAILFLHGFCEDHRVWQPLIDQLSDQFTCISVDLPGFGQSACADKADLNTWVRELSPLLGETKVHIIGHSMGGYTSLAFAELFPNQLKSLCLFHSSCLEDTVEKKQTRSKQIKFIEEYGSEKYVSQLIPSLFAPPVNPLLLEQELSQAKEQKKEGIIQALIAMRDRKDRSEILKNAHFPIHIISGKHDGLLSIEQQAKMLSLPKTAKWTVLDKSGHMGLLEEPLEAAEAIREFISSIEN